MSTVGMVADGASGSGTAGDSGGGVEARFTTTLPAELIGQWVRDVVTKDRRFVLKRVGVASLELVSRVSLLSWGSRISVSWIDEGEGEDVEVVVRASARLRTALGDRGQSGRDIARLRGALRRTEQTG